MIPMLRKSLAVRMLPVIVAVMLLSEGTPAELVVLDQISEVRAVSVDGSVIAGRLGLSDGPAAFRNSSAFRWSRQEGLVELESLNDGDQRVSAGTLSADGMVAAGVSWDPVPTRAVRWVGTGPAENLGALPGNFGSVAQDMSADGSVIVGRNYAIGPTINTAFRWTEADGMQELGSLGSANSTWALGVSGDGSTIVGSAAIIAHSDANIGHEAFIWTEEDGMC